MYQKKANSAEGRNILDPFQLSADFDLVFSGAGGMGFQNPWNPVAVELCVPDSHFPAGLPSVFPDDPDIAAGDENKQADTECGDLQNAGG